MVKRFLSRGAGRYENRRDTSERYVALAIAAARNGDDIALMPHIYVAAEIAAEQPTTPRALHTPGSNDDFLVVPPRAAQTFRDWLLRVS
jgi:DNA-binding transcriptional LysR family regulator